jgi:hypothetical protein
MQPRRQSTHACDGGARVRGRGRAWGYEWMGTGTSTPQGELAGICTASHQAWSSVSTPHTHTGQCAKIVKEQRTLPLRPTPLACNAPPVEPVACTISPIGQVNLRRTGPPTRAFRPLRLFPGLALWLRVALCIQCMQSLCRLLSCERRQVVGRRRCVPWVYPNPLSSVGAPT